MPHLERDAERPLQAQPLDSDLSKLSKDVRAILLSARTGWLSNREVLSLLHCHRSCNLDVCREPPSLPAGGTVFLYDRGKVKSFRKDSHIWKKKKDGKTVRETHEKLKVDNREVLNCYYAHPEFEGFPQRRCYWQLDGRPDIVLVHYLVVDGIRGGNPDFIGSHTQGSNSPGQSCGSVQGLSFGDGQQDYSEGAQSMSAFEPGSNPPRNSDPSLNLKSTAMDCCLEILEDGLKSPVDQQKVDEQYSESFLPEFHQLLPEAVLEDQSRSPAMLEEQSMGWQVSPQLTGLGSHHSVVEDSEGAPILKQEQMQAPPAGLMEQRWSTDYSGGHPQDSATMQLQQPIGPASEPHPFMQAAEYMDMQNSHYNTLSAHLSYPPGQGALVGERGSATPVLASRHSTGSQHLGADLQSLGSSMAMTQQQWPCNSVPSSLLASTQQPSHQQSSQTLEYEYGHQFNTPATAAAYPPPSFSTGSSRVAQSPFSRQASGHDNAASRSLPPPHSQLRRAPSAFVKGVDPVVRQHSRRRSRPSNRSVSMDLDLQWKSHNRQPSWDARHDTAEGDHGLVEHRGSDVQGQSSQFESDVSALKHFGLAKMEPGFIEPSIEERMRSLEEDEVPSRSAAQMTRNKSAPAPRPEASLLSDEMEIWEGAAPPPPTEPTRQIVTPEAPPRRRSLPYRLHEDYAPNWDFTTGGARMILTCSANDDDFEVPVDAQLHVSFDFKEVVANVIRPGVVRAIVPPHEAGQVNVLLTLGDGVPLSNPVPFLYRQNPEAMLQSLTTAATDRELQLQLIGMLAGHSCGSGSSLKEQRSVTWSNTANSGRQHKQSSSSVKENFSGSAMKLTEEEKSALASFQQSEKLLQDLIERKVLQHTLKVLDGRPEITPLQEVSCKDLFTCGGRGVSGLHLLAGLGYDWSLAHLLQSGADPSLQDARGLTPMHWAAARGKLATVALLASHRVDVTVVSHATQTVPSKTAADFAAEEGFLGVAAFLGETQLQQAVWKLNTRSQHTAAGQPVSTIQRKRSRHLPPLLDVTTEYLNGGSALNGNKAGQQGCMNQARPWELNGDDSVQNAILDAKQNVQILQEALLSKRARHTARQQRKSRQQRSEEAQGRACVFNYFGQDNTNLHPVKGNRRQSNLEGANIFHDIPFADDLQTQLQKHSSCNNWDIPDSEGQMNKDIDPLITAFEYGQGVDPTILRALHYVERIATESAATVQEYLRVRQFSQKWLDTLQSLSTSKQARQRSLLVTC